MIKKIGVLTCVLFVIVIIMMVILDNCVVLLRKSRFNIPSNLEIERIYDFVLSRAETDQPATPFYLLIDFDSSTCSFSFSLYCYSDIGYEDLFFIHSYDFGDGEVIKSTHIGKSQNLKEWAPYLYLSEDLAFRTNTTILISEVSSMLETSSNISFQFPVVYCDSRLFDTTGLIYSGK